MTSTVPHDVGGGIVLTGLTKTFPGAPAPAVQPLDLHFPAGRVTVLIGPSGCGKTTTLRMINRLIEPTAGSITIDGVDVRDQKLTTLRRGIGYVIQQVGLFPHRTIADNIATVPHLLGWTKDRTRQRVEELADLVGIDHGLLARYPAELSGGQQQRIGVARALAADPPVLLMDEPFGAVDPIVRGRLQRELRSLQDRLGKTIVLVTHDLDEAITLADQIVLLNVGGAVEQVATPDELLARPANPFVEDFLGGDRSIRRLSIATVADLDLGPGPVVEVSTSPTEREAVLRRTNSSWLGLTDGDRFLGWCPADDVNRGESDLAPQPPAATIHPTATLREALEVILTARTSVAVVLDGDRFVGTVTLESIRAGLDQVTTWTTRRRVLLGAGVVATVAFAVWAQSRIAGLSADTAARDPIFRWEYLFSRPKTRDEIWERGGQHLRLTVIPVLWGLGISAVLAALGRRFRWLLGPIYAAAGALYTIPSLALFSVLLIYNSNETAAIIALTSYTLLILTRTIVDGLDGVPAATLDAADGIGMGRGQRLLRVELPLAAPVILSGLRVATVTTVGLVGISAVIQLGGFASWIFDGYRRTYSTTLILGTVLSVLLAVVLDLALRLVERLLTPWQRRRPR